MYPFYLFDIALKSEFPRAFHNHKSIAGHIHGWLFTINLLVPRVQKIKISQLAISDILVT